MKQGERTKSNIIEAASQLFYENGYGNTAISDIVDVTGLSKGNITYHYKSKDDILNAVLEHRAKLTLAKLIALEDSAQSPRQSLLKFADSLLHDTSELVRYGCKNGSLANELAKGEGHLNLLSKKVFDTILGWLTKQFKQAGATPAKARELGFELLIRGQGICLLSQAYRDEKLFTREVNKLKIWVEESVALRGG